MLKILIVDDSAFARKLIREMIESDPELSVAGEAEDGAKAVKMAGELDPDAIVLDLILPDQDGVLVAENIIEKCSIPIVLFSSLANANSEVTKEFFRRVGLDVIQKPDQPIEQVTKSVGDRALFRRREGSVQGSLDDRRLRSGKHAIFFEVIQAQENLSDVDHIPLLESSLLEALPVDAHRVGPAEIANRPALGGAFQHRMKTRNRSHIGNADLVGRGPANAHHVLLERVSLW